MEREYFHVPVLADEILDLLQPSSNDNFVDGTIGGGGHAEKLLEATGPHGQLLGFDLDPRAVRSAQHRLAKFGTRATVIQGSYAELSAAIRRYPQMQPIQGILVDLGLSSDQLEVSGRGFSFRDQGAADMRFDPGTGVSASRLLASASESELEQVFKKFGEVRAAARLARAIVAHRSRGEWSVPELVAEVMSLGASRSARIHPATKVFQALRIAVNKELDNLISFLPQAVAACSAGGRIAVISYHSLEDRIVKEYFKRESIDCVCPPETPVCRCGHRATVRIVTRRPVVPSSQELSSNWRGRSAKLRVA
ncbi:MAG: 16S rRNA (cytosine(1402)-N(4))-methyltransferase RsmH, partial [Candidatus Komeilibacteria bacterium]|nr:16S rRNA (cytosine(1402)-N(4))-methyltransferase RsmH [Candidatus Komeilibacteria bacterium]